MSEQRNKHQILAVSFVAVLFAVFAWFSAQSAEHDLENASHTRSKGATGKIAGKGKSKNSKQCLNTCNSRQEARQKQFGGNILDRGDVLQIATKEKEALLEKLRVDYGEYFDQIFRDPTSPDDDPRYLGFDPITPDGPSMGRLKRKLQIKVLEVQTKTENQDSDVNGCNCNIDIMKDSNSQRWLQSSGNESAEGDSELEQIYGRYVWATGGHSAAAAHGNLYNESYTAFMERDLKPLFGALGIEFEGRNYAMGGTPAAPEVAACWNQIFGTDVDFFSWDYGMTDGRDPFNLLYYGYRGGLSPGRPAVLGVHFGAPKSRVDGFTQLENLGMASFYGNFQVETAQNKAFPESSGIPDEEIKKLPEYVRNFVCEGKVEGGAPYCAQEKYSKYGCSPRKKQVSWHPGVKSHALDGRRLALFLMQVLMDALKDLADNDDHDPNSLLQRLKEEEDTALANLRNVSLPEWHKQFGNGALDDEDLNTVWKEPGLCRTGRLPARSRYLGYMSNTDKVGDFAVLGQEQYDTGMSMAEAIKPEAANGEFRLVYEPGGAERESCGGLVLKPDYKDFFIAHNNLGLVELTIPNEKEKIAYGYDQSKVKGLLLIFVSGCDWGKCAAADLRPPEAFDEGKVEIFVNDKKVTGLASCRGVFALKGDEGLHWPPSANGDYKIGVLVKEPGTYFRVSSIAVF